VEVAKTWVERCWANVGSSCWFHENWSERWLLPWNNRDGPSYSSLPNLHHVLYRPMNISTQFLQLEWRSSAMRRPAMFIPDLAAPTAPCSSSLLDAATHPSDEQLPPCSPPPLAGVAPQVRICLAPVSGHFSQAGASPAHRSAPSPLV
jgi:hypothetical protein